jgi:hypothetical protein
MIHLTFTGLLAGQTLCMAEKNESDTYHHAIYAPLEKPEYRQTVCKGCLKMWDGSEPTAENENDDGE